MATIKRVVLYACDHCGKEFELNSDQRKKSREGKCHYCPECRKNRIWNRPILTGRRFGKLTAIAETKQTDRGWLWLCKCDCGEFTEKIGRDLTGGNVSSCGCIARQQLMERNLKHGKRYTRVYKIWLSMRNRCLIPNPRNKDYHGRGISILKEWDDFEVFYKWAKDNQYSEKSSLVRTDKDGDYYPENCRWLEPENQCYDRRNTETISYKGKTQSLHLWAKELGISSKALKHRIKIKMSEDDIFHQGRLNPPQNKSINRAKSSLTRESRIKRIYANMVDRCYNDKNIGYGRYGGKGIKVCSEWLENKQLFVEWALANGYENSLTIDRINNNQGYNPDNCRWLSRRSQTRNQSNNVVISYNGEALILADVANMLDISPNTLRNRINSQIPNEKIFTSGPIPYKDYTFLKEKEKTGSKS